MADISLLFDVAGGGKLSGGSGKLIQEQLQEIIGEINNKPLEVKIKADPKSLEEFQNQIANIAKQFKDGISPFGNTTSSSMAAGITQIAQQATTATGALHSMNVAIGVSNISMLTNSLNSLGTGISTSSIDTIASAFTNLDFVITSVTPEIQNLGKEGSRVASLLIQGANEAGNTIQQRLKFDDKGKLLDDLSKIKIKLAEIVRVANNTGKSQQNNLSDEFIKAKTAVKEYYDALRTLKTMGGKVTNTKEDNTGVWSSTEAGYNERVSKLNRVTEAFNTACAASVNFSSTERQLFADYRAEQVERYNIAIEESATTLDGMRKVTLSHTKTIGRNEANLSKWSAAAKASNFEAKTSYENLAAAVERAKIARENFEKSPSITTLNAYTDSINDLNSTSANTEEILKRTGYATKSLGERVTGLAKKFTQWFGVSQVVMYIYRQFVKMVKAVKEIDTAMTELKKVTDETDATYEKFLKNAADRAKKLGATLTDVINTSADFARLGLTLEDAEIVSDAAIVYKNVGDGIEDIDQASESIISAMQAFGFEAKEVMSIVDKFNVTGNKFAISSGGVGDALLNSAAALHAAGNDLDESIGLITAANTTIQDPEKVGTALKTISMYLRAAKTEAEDAGESTEGMANSVSELRSELLTLTNNKVDIMIDDTTFEGTYEIIRDLSKVWDELTDIDTANITELIGGKRNSNVISALIKNFEIAEKVVTQTTNSSGSAMAENEKVLESIQGKINVFQATFEKFASTLISSDLVKGVVDLGTGLLNVVNFLTEIKALLPIIIASFMQFKNVSLYTVTDGSMGLNGNFLGLKAGNINEVKTSIGEYNKLLGTSAYNASAFAEGLKDSNSALSKYLLGLNGTNASLKGYGVSLVATTAKTIGLQAASMALNAVLTWGISLAIQGLITGLTYLIGLIPTTKKLAESLQETAQALADIKSERESLNEELETTEGLISELENKGVLSFTDQAELNRLKQENAELVRKIALLDEERKVKSKEAQTTFKKTMSKDYFTTGDYTSRYQKTQKHDGSYQSTYISESAYISEQFRYLEEQREKLKTASKKEREKIQKEIDKTEKYLSQEIADSQGYIDALVESGYVYGSDAEVDKYIDWIYEFQDKYLIAVGHTDEIFNSIINRDKFKDARIAIEELGVVTADSLANLYKNNDKVKELVEYLISLGVIDWQNILGDKFKDAAGEDGILTTAEALAYMNEHGEVSAKVLGLIAGEFNKTKEAANGAASAATSWSNISKEISKMTDKYDALKEAQKEVNETGFLSIETLDKLAEKYPDLNDDIGEYLYGLISQEEFMQRLQSAYEADYSSYRNALLSKLETSTEYWNNIIETNGEAIDKIGEAYEVDLSNCKTIEEAKAKIRSAYMTAWMQEYNKYVELSLNEAKQLRRDLSRRNASGTYDQKIADLDAYIDMMSGLGMSFKEITVDLDKFNPKNLSTKSLSGSYDDKDTETWFEQQLAKHQHLVAMEQETQAEYLAWLNTAYKKAYKEGIIELDEYYKYCEEVYTGLRDLFKDSLADVEHEISMRENYDSEEKKIISLYQGLIKDVEKEIATARAQGLTDEDDYIQELQSKWQDYTNAIKDIREKIEDAAKDALDEMVDYRVDMLKQEIEDEKDALDKKLDYLKEFYDKQKEMLQDQYDEEKYLQDQAEKRKSVTDIKSELAMLEKDDSAWAQKRKLELQEELSTAEQDLADFEKENALEKALDAIDEAYNSQEAQLQKEMDALDEKLNDPNALFNKALEDIKNNSKNQLYYQMLMYNRQYGSGNDDDIKKLWEDTYGALNDYEQLFGKLYKGVDLKNETGVKKNDGWDNSKVSGTNPDKPKETHKTTTTTTKTETTKPSLIKGSYVQVKSGTRWYADSYGGGSSGKANAGTIKYINTKGSHPYNIDGLGWVKKSDIVGYSSGTKHATAGLHELYEQGSEMLFVSSSGGKYRILEDGDKVLNAKATNFLYDFANGGENALAQMLKNVFSGASLSGISPTVINNEINMGDIVITGSANQKTVSEIRREQRSSVDYMLRELNKLNK